MSAQQQQQYFDEANRLSMDPCALRQKCQGNASILDWTLHNFHQPVCSAGKKSLDAFALSHPNLRAVDGYGVDGCHIDGESSMRLKGGLSHARGRQQLCTRTFAAAPDLTKNTAADASVESRIVQGEDTSLRDRVCDRYSERDFARPMQGPCAYLHTDVAPFPANSRDIMRAADASSTVCGARR